MIGVNNVALHGDQNTARKYVRQAEKLLDALRARLGDSGATVASTQMRWDDAYAYAFIGPGVAKVVITAGYPEVEADTDERVLDSVPDFASGAVLDGWLVQREGVDVCAELGPTQEASRLLGIPEDAHESRRMAVEPSDEVRARWREESGVRRPSQYLRVKPTMFSGKMRQVVQMIMGFGRVARSIYDRTPPSITRAADALPPTGDSWEREVIRVGRQVRYDFVFTRTHGITTAADDRLWLVEIGIQNGVMVMPLPTHDLAATAGFRQKLEDLGDVAGLYALDTLGGWPTGEPFPTGEALDMARTGGYVIRLLEPEVLESFYDCTAYSSCMGWAFNARGSQAHNTAWYLHEDGFKRGVWDAINIQIASTPPAEPIADAVSIQRRLAPFRATKPEAYPWAVRKAQRLSAFQASAVLNTSGAQAMWEALLAQECPPIATASATYRRIRTGLLYWRGIYQPHVQFPEPMLGYCVSFNMNPMPSTRPIGTRRCDTPMHVYFRGDEMVSCSYYYEPREHAPEINSDFEDCMYVGSWQSESVATAACPAMVYTSVHDDRADITSSRLVESITSRDLGYYQVNIVDSIGYPVIGALSRAKAFRRQTTITSTAGETLASSLRVPFFDRCAHYYTVATGHGGRSQSVAVTYPTLGDPQTYTTWRNLGGYTVFSNIPPPWHPVSEHPAGCGPVTARTVWVENDLSITGCAEFAYEGSWATPCQNAEAMVMNRALPAAEFTAENEAAQVNSRTYLVTEGAEAPILVEQRTAVPPGDGAVDRWFRTSPDPLTFETQSIYETCSVLGQQQAVQYDRRMNASPANGGVAVLGWAPHPELETKLACYVGVIGG